MNEDNTETNDSITADWRRGAVIYQIYPRSFLDTNGDGVGDLQGVVKQLDYIAALGVDAIWLSPFFTSPMCDFGYDVADYCDVDPVFGVLDDFDALISKAHALGLKVIIDQVYAHTSDQHDWFRSSRADRTNAKADWYVWADAKPDGAPPNNWQSVFGAAAWTWDARRRQYYFHNFLTSQPALNLHEIAVQDALLDVARFWLERGVDGFRLDAINFCMHDPSLRDNPPEPHKDSPPTRPFDFQEHRYNQSHRDIPKFLERIRALTDQYDSIFTVAEIVGSEPLPEMKAFTKGDQRLTTAYNFDFLYAEQITPALIRKTLSAWPNTERAERAAWAFSNHDAPRAVSRWKGGARHDDAAKLYAMLLMSLRGAIFVYQGEELGLPQAEIAFEDLKDPEAIANWPETLGRDGARTPMPWISAQKNSGFSDAKPWLPIPVAHLSRAADTQSNDPASVLSFVKKLIAIRQQSRALRLGAMDFIDPPQEMLEALIAFTRMHDDETLLCVFNLGTQTLAWKPADHATFSIVARTNLSQSEKAMPNETPPMSGYIAKRN